MRKWWRRRRAVRLRRKLEAGTLTVNQARAKLGLAPVDGPEFHHLKRPRRQ